MSVWRKSFRKFGQVEVGAVHLHPKGVVDVDDVAVALGGTTGLHLLKNRIECFVESVVRSLEFEIEGGNLWDNWF